MLASIHHWSVTAAPRFEFPGSVGGKRAKRVDRQGPRVLPNSFRCPLSVVCCLLSVVCCPLPAARCPLFSTNVVSSAVSSFRSRKFLASIHGQTRRLAHGQSPCIGPPGHKSHRGHRGQRGERSALAPRDTRCGPVRPASLQRSRERARQRAGHSPSTTSYQSVISRWTRWGTLSSGWTVTPTRR